MNTYKFGVAFLSMVCSSVAVADEQALPVVDNVQMHQTASRKVTITYDLNQDAVITLDIQTNSVDKGVEVWTSIGGEHIGNCSEGSDVFRVVQKGNGRRIYWHPDVAWNGRIVPNGGARAVVTAWALDNTPDYMVVDISAGAKPSSQRYYPAEEFLPGGLLSNIDYRQSRLVMRKVVAKDVVWTMGSVSEAERTAANEATHHVMLGGNYYIGVFPVTQAQWCLITDYNPSQFCKVPVNLMRPVDCTSYNEIRKVYGPDKYNSSLNSVPLDADYDQYNWPNDPHPDSFLGKLRTRTQIDFDLPSECQWEFACRAGNGEGFWGNGDIYKGWNVTSNFPGRGRKNGGYVQSGGNYTKPTQQEAPACDETAGTAIVGICNSRNAWGIYDMHGNIWELCLDWFKSSIAEYNGAVYNNQDGQAEGEAVRRGGSWAEEPYQCRSARRNSFPRASREYVVGFRLACTAGLK